METLPFDTCTIGDCAHEADEHLVPVFQGLDGLNPDCDNFNFCASQLRIRMEMAFGLMQIKWGIPQRPVGCSVVNLKWLHNFVVDKGLQRKKSRASGADTNVGDDAKCNATGCLPSIPHDVNGDAIDLNPLTNATAQRGWSFRAQRTHGAPSQNIGVEATGKESHGRKAKEPRRVDI